MDLGLVVELPINSKAQTVKDTDHNDSALNLGTQRITIVGKDVVGGAYPLWIQGETTETEFSNTKTRGRILRLQDKGTTNTFYDFGVDEEGNLFLENQQTLDNPILKISPSGEITLNASKGLYLTGIEKLTSSNVVDLVYDTSTGMVGHQ